MIAGHSGDWLAARARATPLATALIIGDQQWSYSRLDELVGPFAHNLRAYTKKGERVAALLPNDLVFVCLVHAAARIGVILVPLNNRLSANELAWQLKQATCSTLVYDEATADQASSIGLQGVRLVSGANLLADGPADGDESDPPLDLDGVQAIVFTSGTTGKPKGAMLTFSNHFYSAVASGYRLGVLPDDRWLCCLPLYHVGGLAILLRSCLYGTAVELQDGFDADLVNESVDTGQPTLVSLVPTMLHRLLRARDGRLMPGSLRQVLLGGAAVPGELIAACRELGIPVSVTYGLTEAASQVATMPPEDVARKPGSAGKPLLFTQVAIISEDGRALPAGEVGEIIVSGPTVMLGYDRDEASSAKTLQDGWLHTRDIGYLDDDGDLWVMQRRDDIIVSGGENVYPAEVESVVKQHPDVLDACVVGVTDQEWGQRVTAVVVLKECRSVSIEELADHCRPQLAGYKLPRQLLIVQDLPRTASGKIHRRAVADLISSRDRRRQ